MIDKPETICVECANQLWNPNGHPHLYECKMKVSVDRITGSRRFVKCGIKNNGNCADFAPKPPGWFARMRAKFTRSTTKGSEK